MARPKTSESRKAKLTIAEELTHGIEQLRVLSAQIDDLSREGFPYRDAGRARTELSFRETIRRVFGDKSPEYQTHKNHKLRVGNPAESAQSTTLLKQLIRALEDQKADLLGLAAISGASPPVTAPERPTLTAVAPASLSDSRGKAASPRDTPGTTGTPSSSPKVTTSEQSANVMPSPQASDPLPVRPPASVNPPLPVPTPAKATQPISDTSMPGQPRPPSPSRTHDAETTPDVRTGREGTSSVPVPDRSPTMPGPASPAGVAAVPETSEPCSTTPMPVRSAGLQTVVSQTTVPRAPQTVRTPPNLSTPSAEPLIQPPRPAGTVETLDALPDTLSDSTSRAVPIRSMPSIESESPDQLNAAQHVAREVRSTERPSPPCPEPSQAPGLSTVDSIVAPSHPFRNVVIGTEHTETGTLEGLRRLCTRFHLVARQLRLRGEYRPTLEITDEYDLQDLVYALLRLQFDEVGTDEWAPAYASGARRTSYLLDWERIVLVVKQTRSGLTTKDLAEQVKLDAAHYSERPNGQILLCFIYDPEGRVGNPRGLEADLSVVSGRLRVEVIVAPK